MDESKPEKENYKGEKRRFDPELLKKGLRCDLDQYEMLKRCSDKKDMTEWKEWRRDNPNKDVLLEGADLSHTTINDANFLRANLKSAILMNADLRGSCLMHSNLDSADFEDASLPGALLSCASLRATKFVLTHVDGLTCLWNCKVNRKTVFSGVPLDVARIDPGTKQLLEYNIRRMNWEEWYKEHKRLKWLVKPFWLTSDYGLSMGRIVAAFFALASAFAIIYYLCGRFAPPGIVDNLFIDRNEVAVAAWLVPLRTLYFSIVTMTTLGFGDMYANAHSIWGHILLSVQVILGYVLLAALVTRFAVLFTAGGPAGKFADDKKNKIRNAKHEIRDKLK